MSQWSHDNGLQQAIDKYSKDHSGQLWLKSAEIAAHLETDQAQVTIQLNQSDRYDRWDSENSGKSGGIYVNHFYD